MKAYSLDIRQKILDTYLEGEKIQGIPADNLVFLDEARANLSFIRHSTRSQKGKRAHGYLPQKRSKNVSIIDAIVLQNVIS